MSVNKKIVLLGVLLGVFTAIVSRPSDFAKLIVGESPDYGLIEPVEPVRKPESKKKAKKVAQPAKTEQKQLVSEQVVKPKPQNVAVSSNILKLINQLRSERGLNQLGESKQLNYTASLSVQYMIDRQACSNGSTCTHGNWQQWYGQSGFNHFGEIIAACQKTDGELVNYSWRNSPTHYAQMVGANYTHFGVATKMGKFKGDFSNNRTITCRYAVVHFGG